ncbi:hypothetical protein GCM10011371_25680 [Novosphingobium marinum]|uniref:Phenylpropionate dioxygenase-like ring-hydroxylating dioxygenase large terminal subunit n=1 Tax=Novosphingobium marinum TaxID=1514948 RepID=A0A7Y9XUQ3_9SPHN|nr:aromatic ring-hydroxylating dioxygenase subunit alpha [Novosphingobium marinum]NYH94817.1 phenylpropionate dioxygenase-like ring-hydroxylating dioxygenase large terminal subunit [Novosphingobium marinum]GGC37109.1 hypothetical protein GCM10011371_25680 [Novosphingobium marinum]
MLKEEAQAEDRLADLTKQPEPPLTPGNPIDGSRYWSREFMDLEWEHVWTRTWQIAGMRRQLQKPGDFLTTTLGREEILCTLGRDGAVRTFFNVCQHRGMPLSTDDVGHASGGVMACPYHGWRFDMAGVLRSVPDEADFVQGSPCGKLNLVEIRCEVWAGFIWFNLDDGAPPLRTALGEIADQIDTYPMDDMVRTHWVTIEGDFNWKLIQDNFNESYHLPFVHPQLKYVLEQAHEHCQFDLYGTGHSRMLMPGGAPSRALVGGENETIEAMRDELTCWGLDADSFRGRRQEMRAALQAKKRELGAEKGFDFSRYHDAQLTDHWHYTIFPNLSFSLKPEGNIWLRGRPHPTDPEKCYFDMWYLSLFPRDEDRFYSYSMGAYLDKSAPDVHVQGKYDEVDIGPAVIQDVEVWGTQQRGLRSRGYRRAYLAWQERRIHYFHDNLDRMIGQGRKRSA